ncbi:MAG: sodium-dependent phosphate cotransporter [Planctomycetota bacterium]
MTTQIRPPVGIPAALRIVFVIALLYGFLVAIQMLGGSIKMMGKETSKGLFEGVTNPFAGLSVGVLATVLVQSSSTTTATIVSLVGSKALALKSAIPMIMGANIGTTVTNTLVSIGHVRKSAEFKRAFAAATVHDFFNLICVSVLLPLELMTGFLSKTATGLTHVFVGTETEKMSSPIKSAVSATFKGVLSLLEDLGLSGTGLAVATLILGIILTFVCLIFVTKNMRVLISGPLEIALNRALGRSGLIGIFVGTVITIAVQSSSITTSLLVPMCAAGVLTLPNAFPIMLGANIGTTVTGLIASMATDSPDGLTIALVHTLFNLVGVLVFYPIPRIRQIPMDLAERLAELGAKSALWLVLYVLGMFVFVPLLGYFLFQGMLGS